MEKRINFLIYYSGGITLILIIFFFGAFTGTDSKRFEVIEVERINVVEPNGQQAQVISNAKRMPGAIINGECLTDRNGIPGIIFYNSESLRNPVLRLYLTVNNKTKKHK